tara:strand:- start:3361 stop:6294 length:2934 start_codon:yes stop_codon:yes gene_type:complete
MKESIQNYVKAIFLKNGEKVQFKIGQSISTDQYISGSVLFIDSGSARIINKDGNKLSTVKKISSGNIIGAISILRGRACENVRASSDIIAISISDKEFKKLYDTNSKFKSYFDSLKDISEIIEFSKFIRNQIPNLKINFVEFLNLVEKNIELINCSDKKFEKLFKSKNIKIYRSSSSKQFAFKEIDSFSEYSKFKDPKNREGLRFLALEKNFLENLNKIDLKDKRKDVKTISSRLGSDDLINQSKIKKAPRNAPLSVFNNQEISENIIVQGKGLVLETLACFQMLSKILNFPIRKDSLEKILRDCEFRGAKIDLQLIGELLSNLGLHVSSGEIPSTMALRLQTPCVINWKNSFALILKSSHEGILVASPSDGLIDIKVDQIENLFKSGISLLLLEKTEETPQLVFNLSWFWSAIKKYKIVLAQVLIASFIVQLFTLGNPLLIQVIIDKVISQRSLDTLQVLGVALLFVTLLEGILGSLKTFLFAETTNRIDQRLGSEVIDHLLRLPLGYFDKRPVGELGSRIDELEKIREFLTGQALSTILDAIFSLIYILVMFIYSSLLTIIALIVVPIQVAITLIGAPLFRRQFRQSAEANAKTKSHLVEVITSIQTVKSQNIETISRWKWQKFYSKYISRTFERTISGTLINQSSQVLQKISQLLVLWVGATLVLKGQLTLGQLIAFRIISSYVTQPLLRLSSIWQNIQELKVSFERLGDVIDTPQESNEIDKQKISMPPVEGKVIFEDVVFSFTKASRNILNKVSFEIEKGQFVGIVGESGSGKSTLMKLLSRLYSPKEGCIKIDNYDIDKVELYSLRRQIGIVPQEPILFSGTILENIALTQSDANNDDIVWAAKLAEAHEFIMKLPNGYSTNVGERGASLSGGQRQRIAIARTLLSKPKILILDEATSALDYNTENKVCNNLIKALDENTVFFITHRLATVRNSNLIIVMHDGKLDEIGTHKQLMENKGRYFALESQQGKS